MPGVRYRAALCRCGASKNKPFCDKAHEASGFSDRGPLGRTGEALESKGGPLGQSRSRPFCDSTHKTVGFEADGF